MKILYVLSFLIFLPLSSQPQDITATLQGSGSSYGFSVNDNTSTTLFRVRGDGNVGIGTTSPNLKLVVNGQGAFLDRLWIETTNDRPIQILEKIYYRYSVIHY